MYVLALTINPPPFFPHAGGIKQLTAADLYLFDVVENHIMLATDQFLEPFPLLKKHHETVGSHAKIHAYVASGKRPQFPNGPTAIFGGYKEEATN